MIVVFSDLERDDNSLNGAKLTSSTDVVDMLNRLRQERAPFMCELRADNESILTVGIHPTVGCVQYSGTDGLPPYLMATQPTAKDVISNDVAFSVGGTPTPIEGKYLITAEMVNSIVADFVNSGLRSPAVAWVEFA